ncbi:unnamed protein product, partial [Rodentolepis nana]|uniref:PH domain-containing protein n=1 Tax=Rodentolepis nana TaxID=102285 RepID=A0A0R3TR35_RODNA
HHRDSSASGLVFDHVSSSNTSDYATPCGGPSQRVSFETAAVVPTATPEMSANNSIQLNATSPLYEEPVSFIQRLSSVTSSQDEPIPGYSPEHRQLSHPQLGTQNRHSLSSQHESLVSSTSLSNHLQQSTPSVNEGSPIAPTYPTVIETPVPDTTDLGTLLLPKKSSTSSRRGVAPLYTISGALYHRYKPNKWTRLGYCVLTPDAHLLGFRSSANQSASPAVSLFVAAASTVAVYAGRESGMQHVFKVTHSAGLVGPNSGDSELLAVSTHGGRALVFATDCEEEALAWIDQINQYAQGVTPSRVESFTNHFCRRQSTSTHRQHRRRPSDIGADVLSLNDFPRVASTVSVVPSPRRKSVVVLAGSRMETKSSRPHSLFLPHAYTSPNSMENQQKAPTLPLLPSNSFDHSQEDSGFSGLISSSSSATDGTTGEPVTEQRIPLTIGPNSNILRHQRYSVASTASPSISAYDLLQSRASGLLSSVRRKVADSLNLPKRRSLILPPRTEDLLNANQSPSSPQIPRQGGSDGGLVGWTQMDTVLANDSGSYLSADCSVASPRTRSWRSIRGKQQQVKLVAASSRKSSDPPPIDDSVLAGDIFISIPGRLSWTRRYCALRCSNLEIYASTLASTPSSNSDPNAPSCQPLLVLCLPLQPGVVEVSPAADKRHPSAVRLSAPALSPHPLLLDAGDTIIMGRWIRGIIEALGHIRSGQVPSTSNRHSEIITPPSPEPIYDEVASVTNSSNLSKRWTWTSSSVYRPVVMEMTPLPTLPSAGPSSPTGSSHNGGGTTACGAGGIYSSIYYDSVVPVEEDDCEVQEEEDIDNDASEIRLHSSSLHSRTSHDMLSRSFSSLQVASSSDDSTGYSNSLLRNREDLSCGLRLRSYKSLDWNFSASFSQETELPATPQCISDDKVTSFLEMNSVASATPEVSVARSYSYAAQTNNQEKIEEGDLPTPRGITIPLGRVGASPHDPPPIDEVKQNKVETFNASDFADGIEEALNAIVSFLFDVYLISGMPSTYLIPNFHFFVPIIPYLNHHIDAVTNASYYISSPPSSQPSSPFPNLVQRNQQTSRQRGPSKRRRNNRRRN